MTASRARLTVIAGEPTRSDDALCRDFLAGKVPAFGELVQRHQELVWRLVRRYGQTPDDTLDLSQRAFLQALEAARRALPRLGRTGEIPFRAWLLRIAINLGKNHLRDRRRWPSAPETEAAPMIAPDPGAAEQLERKEQSALVRASVQDLPRRQREVFTLRIDGGLTFGEIAEALGIQEGNAKTHFHHAVKRLRERVRAATEEKP